MSYCRREVRFHLSNWVNLFQLLDLIIIDVEHVSGVCVTNYQTGQAPGATFTAGTEVGS